MRVRIGERSDIGLRREVNQDTHGSRQGDYGILLVVCDGMGGHTAGEVASQIAVATILDTFSAELPPEDALRAALTAANEQVYANGHGSMGTTGVAALLRRNMLYVANVGDSRAYLVRQGNIQQISQDHSFVSDQVAAGLMTPEQARHSNVRNIITRALGHLPDVEVDTFSLPVRAGDTVLLSSDGMHGLIDDTEIAEITAMLPPDDAVERLVATANERGGIDNITVMIAQIDEVDPPAPGDPVAPEPEVDDDEEPLPTLESLPPTESPAPAHPVERPLSRLGALLAALTLVTLLSIGGLLFFNAPLTPALMPQNAPPRPQTTTVLPAATPTSAPTPTTP
jgi:PPM family protein phosphatase